MNKTKQNAEWDLAMLGVIFVAALGVWGFVVTQAFRIATGPHFILQALFG